MAVITIREALNQALSEEMQRDENVFLLGEEVAAYQGAYKVSKGLLEEFGERRVIDSPITELGFAGLGVGAAMVGLRPVIEFMTFNFSILATDQIVNSAAKMLYMSGGQFKIPIVFRGPNGSAYQVSSQHSQALESWYAHFPGLKVVMPSTPADAKGLLKTAIRSDDPVLFLEHKGLLNMKGPVPEAEADELIPFGQASVRRDGTDVSVVALSAMVNRTLEAADGLAGEGIEVEVIDPRTVAPLDIETILESVKKTGRLLVVDEDFAPAGMGAEISAQVVERGFDDLDAPVRRLNGVQTPTPYSPPLEAAVVPNREGIARAIRELVAE
jgi:pyruvate dehydrogenase E1 component beta subunit